MAVNFPDNPVLNEEFTSSSRTWIWDGSVWLLKSTLDVAVENLNDVTLTNLVTGQALFYNSVTQKWENAEIGGSLEVSETAPTSPSEGDLWFDSTSGNTYVYYDSYWIETIGSDGIASGGSVASLNAIPDVAISGVSDGQVLSYDSANSQWINETLPSSSYTPPNSSYLNYDTGANGVLSINENGTLMQSDNSTTLIASLTVSTGFTKTVLELDGQFIADTDPEVNATISIQRSTDLANWTTVGSVVTSGIEERSNGAYQQIFQPFSFRYIDTHGASVGDTVSYRFVNITGASNGVGSVTCRQWFDGVACSLSVREVA